MVWSCPACSTALQQQLASLTATVADHETAILELQRQVASLAPDVQSLDTKVRELGVLLSCLWWSVASLSWMRIPRTAWKQWTKKVMAQQMVKLERLSGQVDCLSAVEAQTGAALRASKKQTVRVSKKVTELEDYCTARVV